MKKKYTYYLETGLRRTRSERFSSDKEAWETLRKLLPNKYAVLYKMMPIAVNKRWLFIKSYESKYGTYSKGRFKPSKFVSDSPIPIMYGITTHKWGFKGENI